MPEESATIQQMDQQIELVVTTDPVTGAGGVDYFTDEADSHALHSKALSGAGYTAISQGLKMLMSIASQVILSRLLFPAQFGIVAMVAPVLAIVNLFTDLGLSQAVIQRKRITQEDLSALYWFGIGASSVCALIIIAVSPLVALAYHQRAVAPVCAALALQMPLGALAGHASALMARKMRFGAIATIEVLSQAAGLTVSVISALAGAGYWSLVLGQLAITLTQAVGDRQLSGWRPSKPKWSPTAAPMLTFGANLTGFTLLGLFSTYSDNVLVGILRGPVALGLFDKAFSLVLRPVQSVTAPISRVATPLLARTVDEPVVYRRAYITMLQAITLLGGPGLIVISVRSSELVDTLLGKHWAGAAPIMTWICVAALFTSLSGSSYWLFTSQNRPNEQLKCGLVSSGLVLVSMLAGLPWGPVGIAKSYALFAPVVHGWFIWTAGRKGPVRRMDVVRGIYPLVIALPLAALAVYMLCTRLALRPVADIAFAVLLSYSVTVLVFLLFPGGRSSAGMLRKLKSLTPAAATNIA